jgi:hypothetical protein
MLLAFSSQDYGSTDNYDDNGNNSDCDYDVGVDLVCFRFWRTG